MPKLRPVRPARPRRALLLAALLAAPIPAHPALALDAEWENLGPAGRRGPAAVADTRRHRLLFLGPGEGNGDGMVWSFDPALPSPWASFWHAPDPARGYPRLADPHAVYDSAGDRVVVVDGADLPAIWTLPLSGAPEWRRWEPPSSGWEPAPGPGPRLEPAVVWDAPRGRLVMNGGRIVPSQLGDPYPTWETWTLAPFDTAGWDLLRSASAAPFARSGHVAILDPLRSRLVVLGGRVAAILEDPDAWALDLEGTPAWHRIPAGAKRPAAVWRASAAYDPAMDRMLLLSAGERGTEVWELDLAGGGWNQLKPDQDGPGRRTAFAAAFDPWVRTFVLHGGLPDGAPGWDVTWRLRRESAGQRSAHVSSVVALPGGVTIRWSLGAPPGTRLSVERRLSGRPWQPLGTAVVPADLAVAFTDAGAAPSSRYRYRLGLLGSGLRLDGSEADVEVPDRATLHVYSARPNPTRGPVELDLLAPAAGEIEVELFDPLGRRVRTTTVLAAAPGRRRIRVWSDAAVPPGRCWLRIRQGGRAASVAVTVIR